MTHALKRHLANASLALIGVLAAVFVAEIGARFTGYTNPRFFLHESQIGWTLRPSFSDWYTREGLSYVEVNSQGFRDSEHSKEKPPQTVRIAVLGDSYTAALEVGQQERYSSVMNEQLASCPVLQGRTLEILNFGIPSTGTLQQLLVLRTRVWSYQPDVVMLGFLTKNDITDNLLRESVTPNRPTYVLEDDNVVLDTSFINNASSPSATLQVYWFAYDRSRLLQLLHGRKITAIVSAFFKDPVKTLQGKWKGASELGDEENDRGGGLEGLVYSGPDPGFESAAWDVTEQLLVTMHQEVAAHGARFLLVTLSNGVQVYPDKDARQESMKAMKTPDLFYSERRLRQLAERHDMPMLALAPALEEYADAHHAFLHGFPPHLGQGHWNALGHRVAGEMISRKLCDDILPSVS
jgi:hypothetical protein